MIYAFSFVGENLRDRGFSTYSDIGIQSVRKGYKDGKICIIKTASELTSIDNGAIEGIGDNSAVIIFHDLSRLYISTDRDELESIRSALMLEQT